MNTDDVILLTDDDGSEIACHVATTLTVSGKDYVALYAVDGDGGFLYLMELGEDGALYDIEDDDEFDRVVEAVDEWLDDNECD